MNLEAALQTFIVESRELLLSMEDSLLELERQPDDADAMNATFRAIHTIKGSAGLFGLDDIVRFTHVVESLLDRARNNEVPVNDTLTALMLECGDHIGHLVGTAAGDQPADPAAMEARQAVLLERLGKFSPAGVPGVAQAAEEPVEREAELSRDGGVPVGNGAWHISLRFGRDVLRNGMDPASFLRYLSTLGDVVSTTTLCDAMPEAAEMDPESCYLGFEIDLRSEAGKETIEGAFEFVREDCQIRILPPNSRIGEFVQLIAALPEDNDRIGEILVASGAVTQAELAHALAEQQEAAGGKPRVGEILVEENVVQEAVVQAALDKQKQIKDKRATENRFVRVDAAKLEELINQVGEMVIAGASATLLARRTADGALHEAMSLMGRLVEEIRDCALSLRMVEIGETFNRFQRVVRDVSRELGKEIALEISGGETELDKTVVEKITDPLTHLVRNSIDHGIEPAEVRLARGKPANGIIRLNAYHESGTIVIEVADDGGGLNRDKILSKAIEKGIVAPTQALADQEIYNLVFEPGFSTADQVTNLSGRGVGMDVVRRNIEALRGSIDLDSRPGEGTTFRIRLPLTLAIIDGFLIEVGESSLVVPLDMVVECLELSDADRQSAETRRYLNLRGEVLPFIRLRELLAIEGEPTRRENVVVVQFGGQKAGLVVDQLLGEFQTVIKPLGQVFRHLRGISGSTILGSGEVALILDVPALVQQAASRENEQTASVMQSVRPGMAPTAIL
jgi:two-component system chemotaxis sensor kinase CheA